MKIGITERGDAGLNLGWFDKIKSGMVDGAVLITKNINYAFIRKVLELYYSGYKQLIIHCTCTGFGGTVYEPNVPDYKGQLNKLKLLVDLGFPKKQCVLRIDPIIPTRMGLINTRSVIEYAYDLELLPDIRVRISVLDEYKHVKKRMADAEIEAVYGDKMYASKEQMQAVIKTLDRYDIQFECCAEPYLINQNQFVHTGCISERDLRLMGLEYKESGVNPQNRSGCLCIAEKTELLNNKYRCVHQCIYCYWQDKK